MMGTRLQLCAAVALLAACSLAGGTLTTVAEANGVDLEELTSPRAFAFTGTVLQTGRRYWAFADRTGGSQIVADVPLPAELRQWDEVCVAGEMRLTDADKTRTRRLLSREVEILRHGAPLPPVDATVQEINAGRFDFTYVRVRGVFASGVRDEVDPDFFWVLLKSDGGKCRLIVNEREFTPHVLSELADAEVEVVGLARPITGLRQNLGYYLQVTRREQITVVKPAPKDPLDVPPYADDGAMTHRKRISGDVVATARGHFFLRTDIGRIVKVVPVPGAPTPQPGDRVVVAGFPEHVPYWLCLSDALVKVAGRSGNPAEAPQRVSMAKLFSDAAGRRRFSTPLTGNVLTVRGQVVSATADELEVSDGENAVFAVLGAVRGDLRQVPEVGSTVEVTGLVWPEFHNKYEADIYPVFLRFTLYPRAPGDVRVVASPPWWTPSRLALLALVLAALLAVSFAWNVAVNRKAERRGRALYEERASHAIAEKKVEERTRLAVELHDSISQTLTGIAMQLEVGAVDTAKTMLTSCRSDLRRCLWDLRSRTFEEKDMTEAIARTLEPHAVGVKIAVRFNVPRERLSDSTTHTILHVVRELVVNAIRHGRATEVKVAGECHGDVISFSVRDNGAGFDPAAAPGPAEGHFGLLGIRERLKAHGGTLQIDSAPGAGAKFTIAMSNPQS